MLQSPSKEWLFKKPKSKRCSNTTSTKVAKSIKNTFVAVKHLFRLQQLNICLLLLLHIKLTDNLNRGKSNIWEYDTAEARSRGERRNSRSLKEYRVSAEWTASQSDWSAATWLSWSGRHLLEWRSYTQWRICPHINFYLRCPLCFVDENYAQFGCKQFYNNFVVL